MVDVASMARLVNDNNRVWDDIEENRIESAMVLSRWVKTVRDNPSMSICIGSSEQANRSRSGWSLGGENINEVGPNKSSEEEMEMRLDKVWEDAAVPKIDLVGSSVSLILSLCSQTARCGLFYSEYYGVLRLRL